MVEGSPRDEGESGGIIASIGLAVYNIRRMIRQSTPAYHNDIIYDKCIIYKCALGCVL